MIWAPRSLGIVFSLVSWLLINQFGHGTHQIEAGYLILKGTIYIITDNEPGTTDSKVYKKS